MPAETTKAWLAWHKTTQAWMWTPHACAHRMPRALPQEVLSNVAFLRDMTDEMFEFLRCAPPQS
jgi:hypothetical protein